MTLDEGERTVTIVKGVDSPLGVFEDKEEAKIFQEEQDEPTVLLDCPFHETEPTVDTED